MKVEPFNTEVVSKNQMMVRGSASVTGNDNSRGGRSIAHTIYGIEDGGI